MNEPICVICGRVLWVDAEQSMTKHVNAPQGPICCPCWAKTPDGRGEAERGRQMLGLPPPAVANVLDFDAFRNRRAEGLV